MIYYILRRIFKHFMQNRIKEKKINIPILILYH